MKNKKLTIYNIFNDLIKENVKLNRVKKHVVYGKPTINDIKKAIDSNYRYRFKYQGKKEKTPSIRMGDFYCLGVKRQKNGKMRYVVRIYQTSGFSISNPPFGDGWKTLYVDKISWLEETGQHVGNKPLSDYFPDIPKFNPNGDKWMTKVLYIKKY